MIKMVEAGGVVPDYKAFRSVATPASCSMLFSSDSDPDDVVEELDPEELSPPPPAAEVRFRSLSSRLHRLRRLFTYTQEI